MKLEYVACSLCGEDNTVTLYESDFKNAAEMENIPYNYTAGEWQYKTGRIVKCRRCGLVYVNPRPKNVENNYMNEEVDGRYLKSFNQRKMTSRSDLTFIEKMRRTISPGTILDVGCSCGDFLSLAREKNWDVSGVELNKNAYKVTQQRRLHVYNKTLREIDFKEGSFDVVTLWGVIEHFCKPLEELHEIERILKSSGLLFLTTPLIDTLFTRIMRKRHPSFLGQHLYYFSRKTIKELLNKAKLKIISITPHLQFLQCDYIGQALERYGLFGKALGSPLKSPFLKNRFINLSLFHIESTIVAAKSTKKLKGKVKR